MPSQKADYMAQGILGQYIYVNPAKNIVIVKLGKDTGGVGWGSLLSDMAHNVY